MALPDKVDREEIGSVFLANASIPHRPIFAVHVGVRERAPTHPYGPCRESVQDLGRYPVMLMHLDGRLQHSDIAKPQGQDTEAHFLEDAALGDVQTVHSEQQEDQCGGRNHDQRDHPFPWTLPDLLRKVVLRFRRVLQRREADAQPAEDQCIVE